MFDALIAGGGPAGAVTALCLARQGARVAVLEAVGYEADRFGETLPPEITPVLKELDLWNAFEALKPVMSAGIVCSWGSNSAQEQDFICNPFGTGWRVDRRAFDAMLLTEARRAGAEFFEARADAPVRNTGKWRIAGLETYYLVDATGRNGITVEGDGGREIEDVLLAITLKMSYGNEPPADSRTYIETTPDGWWYTGLLPDGGMMAMFFTDPETYTAKGIVVGEQFAATPLTRARLQGAKIVRSMVLYAPSSCRKTISGPGWLPVGDSATCYDPLSGRGVFKAIRHGAAAGTAVLAALQGQAAAVQVYAKNIRAEFDSYSRQRTMFYAVETRWKDSGFWRRRLGVND
jgi:flavin-dependent dehydrogenase